MSPQTGHGQVGFTAVSHRRRFVRGVRIQTAQPEIDKTWQAQPWSCKNDRRKKTKEAHGRIRTVRQNGATLTARSAGNRDDCRGGRRSPCSHTQDGKPRAWTPLIASPCRATSARVPAACSAGGAGACIEAQKQRPAHCPDKHTEQDRGLIFARMPLAAVCLPSSRKGQSEKGSDGREGETCSFSSLGHSAEHSSIPTMEVCKDPQRSVRRLHRVYYAGSTLYPAEMVSYCAWVTARTLPCLTD